jgi:hypothetical protein
MGCLPLAAFSTGKVMEAHIKDIQDKIDKYTALLKLYTNALESVQKICEHEWNYDGHGHNSNFYICSKCGETKDE